ncbi:MFS transporter [Bifidobacterium sp. ESL0769]|uniref:MFS transporter n=1 Tax=Bifidobacterium sp. ESL0769 TaxID=2983229 RepID=UPI0023F9B201|nr:MFS transporter [Bifidobacterium sp. ESL0769]WEV67655.1 MFS transporter [Bifidobacterium sp. ESL0769]
MAETKQKVLEPTTPGTSAKIVGGAPLVKYVIAYTIGALALFACYSALSSILLPNQIQGIEFNQFFKGTKIGSVNDLNALADLVNSKASLTGSQKHLADIYNQYSAARAKNLSYVHAIASLFTMFVQPIVGVVSDRWRSRWGRRSFWIVAGATFGAVLMLGLRFSTTIILVGVFFVATSISLNCMQGPFTTTIADRITDEKLGLLSSFSGMGMMIGGLCGSFIAGTFFAVLGLNVFFVFAVLIIVGALVFVLLAPDRSSKELKTKPIDWKTFFKNFIIPLKDHDYRWTWLARFSFMIGYQAINVYTLFILQSYIHPAFSANQANKWAPILSMIGMPGMIIAMLVGGALSDKFHNRKFFVFLGALIMAIGLFIPIVSPTFPAIICYAVLGNMGMGLYTAVDQALFIDVLPDKQDAGRDLGTANVATNLGQMLAPVIGGQLVSATITWGSGYRAIYILSCVCVLIGGIAVYKIRNVK